jgi:hypothetical protein
VSSEEIGARMASTARRAIKAISEDADSVIGVTAVRDLMGAVDALSAVRPQLEAMERELGDAADRQLLELEGALREACRGKGWHVDGVWPTLYVERSVAVEVDPRQRTIAVAGRRTGGVSVGAIIGALEPIVRSLVPKEFSVQQFIDELVAAYEDARGSRSQVPIFDIYRALVVRSQKSRFWRDARSETFVELTVEQLRARLSKVLEESNVAAKDGRRLRLLPPLNAKDGLFLYQPAEARFGFIGRCEFLEDR